MKAITAQLQTITPANGYTNDMSDFTDEAGRPMPRVFRGRVDFGDSDPLPMLVVVEDPKSDETSNGGVSGGAAMNVFRVVVQGFVADAAHALDPAYVLSAEVTQALVAAKTRGNVLGLGRVMPSITAMSIGQPKHRTPPGSGSDVTHFAIPITLTLAENLEAPFA
ncbi:hypothetical protein [Rhizobium wenxiniae]|uniref:hypothetical protein n=1 Tax=Rhizobium wenxiniae TaxID=1737357 RepID=UPI003C25B336